MIFKALDFTLSRLHRESLTSHPAGILCPLSPADTSCIGKRNLCIHVPVMLSALLSTTLGWDGQRAPSQVICGSSSESQAISELERIQKATFQMKKLRLIGLTKATWLFINNARAVLGWSAQREGPTEQPIKGNLSAAGHRLADR